MVAPTPAAMVQRRSRTLAGQEDGFLYWRMTGASAPEPTLVASDRTWDLRLMR